MENYLFTYLDRRNDVIITNIYTCDNKKHSLLIAKELLNELPIDSYICKIKTRKLTTKDII